MQTKTCSIVLLAILGGVCFAEIIIETLEQRKSVNHLIEATVQILNSCYGEDVNGIGVHGDPTGFLPRALLSKLHFPVISMDNTTEVDQEPVGGEFRYKLHLFTIVTSSTTHLQGILEKMRKSLWWNHMASLFIVNWTINSDDQCSNAFDFLWVAWQMNLLDVNFLCVNRAKEVLLYTFNPYTEEAPNTWKMNGSYKGTNDHPWSMFVYKYRDNGDVCESLNFDKTRDIGGYRIPASVQEIDTFWHTNLNKTGPDSFEGLEGMVIQTIFRTMNAGVELETYSEDAPFIVMDEEGKPTGFIVDIINGPSDIVLSSWYVETFMNLTVTYPHWIAGVGVVTHHSDALSQLSKLNSVIDVSSRYCLYLVILITVAFFKLFVSQALMTAILSTLRLICNTGLPQEPRTTATRIYLGALLFFQITIMGIYQGRLASLLTKDQYHKNVNTIQDLVKSGYTIHANQDLAFYFENPVFKDRFIGHEIDDCVQYILNDPSAACVEDWDILRSKRLIPELHLSSDTIIEAASVYAIREDWPLEKRVNQIIGRMVDADLVQYAYMLYGRTILSINRYNEQLRDNQGPRVLTLKQLHFAFALLVIGLGFATVAFIVEVIIGSAKRWQRVAKAICQFKFYR